MAKFYELDTLGDSNDDSLVCIQDYVPGGRPIRWSANREDLAGECHDHASKGQRPHANGPPIHDDDGDYSNVFPEKLKVV